MAVELRPLGVKCNIQCQYCYQNPQRDAGNVSHHYNMDVMMKAVETEGGPFTLFGGEPLLMPIADLEKLWAWGLEKFGQNSMQTNGALITDAHIDLIRRYKVQVGISIDGPGELNDARWAGNLERTRETTARVQAVIERLCREGLTPTLIVTLHRGNATADKLPAMHAWFKSLQATGVRSARLHLLEVDHADVRAAHAMTSDENRAAVRAFAALESELSTLRLDLFDDIRRMLTGQDDGVTCVWGACDPYTTSAVRGVEGNGQRSNCGRTNKDGIDFAKAADEGYERYLALYHTPQAHGGCQGCRFFVFCKGQCPGTALDNDWRNRSEHCAVWMESFEHIEKELLGAGHEPLSLSPLREPLEALFLSAWERGHNTSLEHALKRLRKDPPPAPPRLKTMVVAEAGASPALDGLEREAFILPPFTRVAWTSDAARDAWAPRLKRLRSLGPELEWRSVAAGARPCAVIPWPGGLQEVAAPWIELGLTSDRVDDGRVVVGKAQDVAAFVAAQAANDAQAVGRLLGHPDCCCAFLRRTWDHDLQDPTWPMAVASVALRSESDSGNLTITVAGSPLANNLWRWLGIRAVAHTPCRFDCPATIALADRAMAAARDAGLGLEMDWLFEILSWPVEWSALHGIAEIRTPVLKINTRTDATVRRHAVRLTGQAGSYPQEGSHGVRFPYEAPARAKLTVSAGFRRGIEHSMAKSSQAVTKLDVVPSAAMDRDGAIHTEALAALVAEGRVAGRSLRHVHLTPYFTVVELDDGSVGSGMSYYQDADFFRQRMPRIAAGDPLLLGWLFDETDPLARLGHRSDSAWHLIRSLRTAVLSALAAPCLEGAGSAKFKVCESAPIDPFADARRAVVIGFGGYLNRLAAAPQIQHLHVCDLGYATRREAMETQANEYRRRHPSKRITLSDGSDAEMRIQSADALAITGSALCNGTMEQLLRFARGGPVIVVQGQSAAIHPLPFFRRGVRMIATTRKPPELARQAAADPSGGLLRPSLEGGLPWIYIVPSEAGDPAPSSDPHPAAAQVSRE